MTLISKWNVKAALLVMCMICIGLLPGCASIETKEELAQNIQTEFEITAAPFTSEEVPESETKGYLITVTPVAHEETHAAQNFFVEHECGKVQSLETFVPKRTERVPVEERLIMGITRRHHDDIGAILQAFRNDVDFETVNPDGRDLDLDGLTALFINCGVGFNHLAIRNFVYNGGIVYASDLTSTQLIRAFPSKFKETGSGNAGVERNAQIVHSGLASQMGTDTMDIVFNMGGWSRVDVVCDDVTVFITGLFERVRKPLAFSFDYGQGRVFYTTFHNNAQASRDMIVFIEYLVFSILNIEADRELKNLFEREGFVMESSNFARFGVTVADIMEQAGLEVTGDVMMEAIEWDSAYGASVPMAPSLASPDAEGEALEIVRATERRFVHNFNQGENILVIVDSAGEGFTLAIEDPAGNVFEVRQEGVRLSNVRGGDWIFTLTPDDVYTNHTFTLGVGRQP